MVAIRPRPGQLSSGLIPARWQHTCVGVRAPGPDPGQLHRSQFEALVLLCRFFPGKIMVIAESRQEMHRLTHRLRKRLTEPVVTSREGSLSANPGLRSVQWAAWISCAADVVILARANQALRRDSQRPALLTPATYLRSATGPRARELAE